MLLRQGQTASGYPNLQQALNAVQDADILEIRTEGPVAGGDLGAPTSGPRRVTLRAAPGYRPVITSRIWSDGANLLTVEGLHFHNAVLTVASGKPTGGLIRIANCSFDGDEGKLVAAFRPAASGGRLEVQNCFIPRGITTGRREKEDTSPIVISNSVLGVVGTDPVTDNIPLEIRQSIVGIPLLGEGRVAGPCVWGPLVVTAEASLFHGGSLQDTGRLWRGSGNAFALFFDRPLQQLRDELKSPEEGSAEAEPAVFDPNTWQLLPDSPGYRQGPEGRDFGADVSKIARAVEPRATDGTPAEPATSGGGNADRRATEWILSLGGYGNMVTIRVGDQERVISAVKDLPADHWQLVRMELRERGTDDGLKNLKGLTNLTNLLICGPGVTDAGLANLQGLTKLESLVLHGTSVTDAGLEHLKSLPSLQSLALQVSRIGGTVSGNRVRDTGMRHLKDLPELWYLELSGQPVTDAGLEHIASLAKLTNLELGYTSVSDAGLKHLKSLTNLRALGLDGTLVSDAGLEYLKDLPNLNSLCLRGTNVTDAALPFLVNHGTKLRLDDARISTKGFADLKVALPGADIVWSERNRTAAEAVLAAGGKLSIRTKGQADDRSVTAVSELPAEYFQVSRVVLVDVPKIPDDLFGKLSVLNDPAFDHLELLDLSGSPILDCRGLEGLTTLKDLSLARTKVSDAGLEPSKQLKELRRLVLDACPINGTGLTHLKDLTNLTELRLSCPQVGDLGIVSVGQMNKLERLSLAGSSISDEGLQQLRGLTNLKDLDLSQTKTTAEGLTALQNALPQCRVRTEISAKLAE